ncbi:MAG: glycosyl hydrolase family 18 protein [candidate division WOR-3 bacterium]
MAFAGRRWLAGLLITAGPAFSGIHQTESETHKGKVASAPAAPASIAPLLVPRPETTLTRSVYGYLPYWVDERWLHYDLLSRIGLFDVTLNPNGSISNPNNFPGRWAAAIDRAHRNGVKVEMVATCFGGSNVRQAIRSAGSIPNLVALASSAGVDGINIDFEDVLAADRDTLTLFVRRLSAACRAAGLELTMATPPLNQSNAFDLQALADTTDGLFMMGYDFHWRGCPEAGPVAPLTGWTYYGNLQMAINRYLSEIGTLDKVWLGLPHYGYQWPTYADTAHSRTTGSGTALSYSSAARNAAIRGYRWNAEGQSPWFAFDSSGWYQGWFDDDTSLLLKYREVHEHGFFGTGMWALGYEGSRPEIWAALRESFNRSLLSFTNGDCETWRLDTLAVPSDTSPNPVGWCEGRKARFRRETDIVRSGAASIRQLPDSLGYPWPAESKVYQDVRVVPGTGYEFSGWCYKNDGRGNRAKLLIEWQDSTRRTLRSDASMVLTSDSTGWRFVTTGGIIAPASAATARLCLWIEGRGGADYWDDLSFRPSTGVAESPGAEVQGQRRPTVVRGILRLPASPAFSLYSTDGRKVIELRPGLNEVRQLKTGVYFICPGRGSVPGEKVVVLK